jgi:hypothetical protein
MVSGRLAARCAYVQAESGPNSSAVPIPSKLTGLSGLGKPREQALEVNGEGYVQVGPGTNQENDYVALSRAGEYYTTLIVWNIPATYTFCMLQVEWDKDGAYDLLWLSSEGDANNRRYAIINFCEPHLASAFKSKWDRRRMRRFFSSRSRLDIGIAAIQGCQQSLYSLVRSSEAQKQLQAIIYIEGRVMRLWDVLAEMQHEEETECDALDGGEGHGLVTL